MKDWKYLLFAILMLDVAMMVVERSLSSAISGLLMLVIQSEAR